MGENLAELAEELDDAERTQKLRWCRMLEVEDEIHRAHVEWREQVIAFDAEWRKEAAEWRQAKEDVARLSAAMDRMVSQ